MTGSSKDSAVHAADHTPVKRSPWYFNDYLVLAFRLILAAVFIYAALQKIGRPLAFADEILMYRILDVGPPLYIIAILLPWIELLCGLSLLSGLLMRGAALTLLVVNAVFLVAVSMRTVGIMGEEGIGFMSVYFDCGCGFGATHAWKKLLEDFAFFLFSLVILLKPEYRFALGISRRLP